MADRNEKTSQLSTFSGCGEGDGQWYDLFSRGARDWLRHNEKIRKAVQEKLPELISSSGVLGGDGNRTVKVPVKFLEHFRFRLHESKEGDGAGQGEAKPGDVLAKPTKKGKGGAKGEGGNEDGGYEFVLELKVDDIVDWLWEELKLPNLQTKEGATQEDAYTREGWNKRGARSRLDRRRSMKESIKRRAVNPDGPMFVNEDLRYRQLVMRERPTTQAVVIFAMDVSSSMRDRDRQLAKTFFFWVVQGLRRQYTYTVRCTVVSHPFSLRQATATLRHVAPPEEEGSGTRRRPSPRAETVPTSTTPLRPLRPPPSVVRASEPSSPLPPPNWSSTPHHQ